MKLVEKVLLLNRRVATSTPVTWASYVTALAPPAWWRMRDTSGVTVVNSGSLGSAVNLTAIAWTMNQAGQLGAGEAGLTDGATTRLQCANNATLAGLLAWEYVFLINPASAGENNAGAFFCWGNDNNQNLIKFAAAGRTITSKYYSTTAGFVTTTSTALSASVWQLVFFAFDNAGDRKLHIYIGVGGAVSEADYAAQGAMTGTYKVPSDPLNLFNFTGQANTFAGLADEVFIVNGNLTPTQRSTLCTLAGV